MYRFVNEERRADAGIEMQWEAMLRANLPKRSGEPRVALWETRNLHMAGHIRRMASQVPGGRVLVIVGAAHKPFFEAYLRQMMGVKVLRTSEVLPAG